MAARLSAALSSSGGAAARKKFASSSTKAKSQADDAAGSTAKLPLKTVEKTADAMSTTPGFWKRSEIPPQIGEKIRFERAGMIMIRPMVSLSRPATLER